MNPSYLTLQVANGRNPLKMIEGEITKMSRGGFLRGLAGALGAPSTVAGAVVKAAVPAVAQAVVQHVAKPAEDPKVAQHKIDHGHVVNMFRKYHDSVGNKDIHRDSDVQHYAPMNAWTDAGESVAYKHKSGKFVRYDDNVMSGYGPSGRVTYNVHTYDPKSGELTHHSPQIDTRSAPDTDDYEGAEGQVAAHNWQKSQINKHLEKFEGLGKYHDAIKPTLSAHGYTHEIPHAEINKIYRIGAEYRKSGSWTPDDETDWAHLENPRFFTSHHGGGGQSASEINDYMGEPPDGTSGHHLLVTGLDKQTGKPSFEHAGPDYSTTNMWGRHSSQSSGDRSDPAVLKAHLDKHHAGFSQSPAVQSAPTSMTPDQEHNEWFSARGFKKQGHDSDLSYYMHPRHGSVSVDWQNRSKPYIHNKSGKSFSSLQDLSKHLSGS